MRAWASRPPHEHPTPGGRSAVVEIVVPVYNEEAALDGSIRRLHAYLAQCFPLAWLITIAGNGSTDRGRALASRLAAAGQPGRRAPAGLPLTVSRWDARRPAW